MQRRTFMQLLAAAMGTAATGKVGMVTAPSIDYRLFTSPWRMSRYDLDNPWERNDWVYASDGRILMCHPGTLTGTGTARVPSIDGLWWDAFERAGWTALPDGASFTKWHTALHCGECCGTGRLGGWSGEECPACNNGFARHAAAELVGNRPFCPGYMSRLRTIQAVEYKIVENPQQGHDYVLAWRASGGMRGFLCGLNDPRRQSFCEGSI